MVISCNYFKRASSNTEMVRLMRLGMTYLLAVGCVVSLKAQHFESGTAPSRDRYLSEQKTIGQSFSGYFYRNFASVHRLPEERFTEKIDSARNRFSDLLHTYSGKLDPAY